MNSYGFVYRLTHIKRKAATILEEDEDETVDALLDEDIGEEGEESVNEYYQFRYCLKEEEIGERYVHWFPC